MPVMVRVNAERLTELLNASTDLGNIPIDEISNDALNCIKKEMRAVKALGESCPELQALVAVVRSVTEAAD